MTGAIVAGGGGGVFDSVSVWRPAEVGCSDCSNNKRVHEARDFFRLQKETNLVLYKKR